MKHERKYKWLLTLDGRRVRDISGDRFGRLVALAYSPQTRRWHCRCDCGGEAITTINNLSKGDTKSCGCLHREQSAANLRTSNHARGERVRRYRGGRCNRADGYQLVRRFGHPRASSNGYVLEHVAIVTDLGIDLPAGAVIHHVNGDPSDNRNQNLVICQDQGYHMFLHMRQRQRDAAREVAS